MVFARFIVVLAVLCVLPACGDGSATNVRPTVPAPTQSVSASPTATAPMNTAALSPSLPGYVIPDTGIKRDSVKYPQDTPDKAFESIATALEANDLAYQIAWLFTPDYTQRMLEKYKTIDAAVAANQEQRIVDGRKALLDSIRKMQAARNTTQGVVNGVKWFCYHLGESQLIQLELQPDGRWCMNPKVREKK